MIEWRIYGCCQPVNKILSGGWLALLTILAEGSVLRPRVFLDT